jgi:16S rRNA (guanine966-N2)-methyltransferase
VIAVLRSNLETLGVGERARIWKVDAVKFMMNLQERSFDVVFADPPYASGAAVRLAERWLEVPYTTLLCIEHDAKLTMPSGGETRRYGTSSITFYR